MLRVMTFNANGIWSAARKGFFTWLRDMSPDVLCIQETKAQEHQVPPKALDLDTYASSFVDAQKKGYSGVAIYGSGLPMRSYGGSGCPTSMRKGGAFVSIGAT